MSGAGEEPLPLAKSERRRRRFGTCALLGCVLAVAVFVAGASGGALGAYRASRALATASLGARVVPRDPASLAVAADGALYVGDRGRHQVLARLANGQFRVAVGTGVAGVSGDGGSALRAEIDNPDALLAGPGGALYIFDDGDTSTTPSGFTAEVREVAPDGKIRTVVGACSGADATAGARVRAAIETPSGTIGPNGDLYLLGQACGTRASGPVLELTASGKLVDWPLDSVLKEVSCLPPSGIAVSRSGALYAACDSGGGDSGAGHGKELLIVEPNGTTKAFPGVYPYDDEGGLASAPDGTVVVGDYLSVVRATTQTVDPIIDLSKGSMGAGALGPDSSMEPNGIAVDRHDNIYLAATSGSGNGTFTGIVEIHANGHVHVLWSRPLPIAPQTGRQTPARRAKQLRGVSWPSQPLSVGGAARLGLAYRSAWGLRATGAGLRHDAVG
jgi:hypothetical protein